VLDFFADWLHFRVSPFQRVLLKSVFGLPLHGPEEWGIYQRATGRTRYLRRPYAEATVISGARGGKSILAAGICLYKALFSALVLKDTDQSPWAVVIAQDRTAAQ
jgi:hypothetical protein